MSGLAPILASDHAAPRFPEPPTHLLPPDQERHFLNALFSSALPLSDLARSLSLTLLDLLELIASPRIQARLAALEQAAHHAVRAAASTHLPAILDTLTGLLHGHRRDLDALNARADEASVVARRHERVHLRRAAVSALRLSRLSPLAPDAVLAPTPRHPSPSWLGGRVATNNPLRRLGGEGFASYPSSNPQPPAAPQPQRPPTSLPAPAASSSSPNLDARVHASPPPATRSSTFPQLERLLAPPAPQRPRNGAVSSLLRRAGALPGPAP